MNTTTSSRPRAFTRLTALAAAALTVVGLSLAGASPALAHDELVGLSAIGGPDSNEAPGVQLDFNNEVMPMGSEMIATAADGSSLLDGEPVVEGRSVTQRLIEGLADDEYSLAWRVVSSDGHPIQGLVSFTITDGYVSDVAVAAADADGQAEHAEHDHEHADHDEADHTHDGEMTTQTDAEQDDSNATGSTLVGWVVLAVVLVGTAAFLTYSARKRARRTAQNEVPSSSGSNSSSNAGGVE